MRGSKLAIGIDLGTTKCCVGVVRDGRVEIVENERGRKTTPSYVAFTSTERLVGEEAKDQVALNPANTVFGVKGLIGRSYEQALTHCQENHLPFSLENSKGKPLIAVKYLGKDVKLAPEQIAAMLLSKMKQLAESHLGCEVTDAVISVPVYFNNAQRLSTKAAAEIAGLNVLRLINEPTAAALAFKAGRTTAKKETVVILDIGGGTFDAAVSSINKNSVKVVGVHGDCYFGGQCFDNFMINHFVKEFSEKHGRNLEENKKSMERLRIACTKIKHTLTLLANARHSIDCILGEIDFDVEMTRTAFDDMSSKFIKEKMRSVLTLLPPESVRSADYVVAVGGSIRIPKIESFIVDYFEKKLTKTINIDEAVAYGAAFLAAHLSGDNYVPDVQVVDRTPHIIDVIPTWEKYETLINRSLPWAPPISKDVLVNGETTFFEFVFYADHKKTEYNQVGNISFPGPHNHSEEARPVPIQYERNKDGIFWADVSNQPAESNQIPLANLQLETIHFNDIRRMRQVEEQFEEQKQLRLKQAQALCELEHLCFELKQNCEQHREMMRGDPAKAMRVCNYVLECLDTTPDVTLAVLLKYKAELMEFVPGI